PGETISSSAFKRSAGGKGANQAAALAKAGMETYFAGKAGADGAFLRGLLNSYGVDTRYLREYPGATGSAIIQLDASAQNSIILFAGGNGEITLEEAGQTLSDFSAGDTVILQNEIPLSAEIIKIAKARGLTVAFNPSPYDRRAESCPLDEVDILFVNEIEGAALAALPASRGHEAALDALLKRFPRAEIVLTAGKDGAYYAAQNNWAYAAPVPVEVADTTGAGDTFLGYFIAARARGFSPDKALSAACRASSIAVSRAGAMEAIPLSDEVF
ncbi:MAG: ribokinase, partial [Spirochaetaceae bacterium]|nr:ribokinase [Spirochaetaceae bacterium]